MEKLRNFGNIMMIALLAGNLIACGQNDTENETDFADTEGPEVNMSGREGEMVNFDNWDTDRNQEINEQEFHPSLDDQNTFTNWDANRDNNLERREFEDNVYSDMDRNRDQNIDRNEFDTYTSSWYNNEQGNFEDWDTDKNNMISNEEFRNRTSQNEQNNLFARWDTNKDGRVDQNEYKTAMFQKFDKDNNGRLDQNEFAEVSEMMSNMDMNMNNMNNNNTNSDMNNNQGTKP